MVLQILCSLQQVLRCRNRLRGRVVLAREPCNDLARQARVRRNCRVDHRRVRARRHLERTGDRPIAPRPPNVPAPALHNTRRRQRRRVDPNRLRVAHRRSTPRRAQHLAQRTAVPSRRRTAPRPESRAIACPIARASSSTTIARKWVRRPNTHRYRWNPRLQRRRLNLHRSPIQRLRLLRHPQPRPQYLTHKDRRTARNQRKPQPATLFPYCAVRNPSTAASPHSLHHGIQSSLSRTPPSHHALRTGTPPERKTAAPPDAGGTRRLTVRCLAQRVASAICVGGRRGRKFAVRWRGGAAPTVRPGLPHPPASGRLPREAAGAGLYRRECGDGAAKRRLRGFAITIPDAGKPRKQGSPASALVSVPRCRPVVR